MDRIDRLIARAIDTTVVVSIIALVVIVSLTDQAIWVRLAIFIMAPVFLVVLMFDLLYLLPSWADLTPRQRQIAAGIVFGLVPAVVMALVPILAVQLTAAIVLLVYGLSGLNRMVQPYQKERP